jgi:hypothetical protein
MDGYKQMQSIFTPATLSLTGTMLVWIVGAVAGALRACEQPGAAAQAQLALRVHWRGGFPRSMRDELLQSGPV